jgi:hypothetical protein
MTFGEAAEASVKGKNLYALRGLLINYILKIRDDDGEPERQRILAHACVNLILRSKIDAIAAVIPRGKHGNSEPVDTDLYDECTEAAQKLIEGRGHHVQ